MEAYYQETKSNKTVEISQRIKQSSHAWQRALSLTLTDPESGQIEQIGILLSAAYPNHIAQRQSDGSRRYKLANGRLARFLQSNPLEHEEYLVIIHLNGAQPVS